MEGIEWSGVPEWCERQMAVNGHVNLKNERWEVDEKPRLSRSYEATAALGDMGAQTVEGHR